MTEFILYKTVKRRKASGQIKQRTDVVGLDSKVRLKDVDFGDVEEYAVVGPAEANPNTNKVSNESPVGKAVLGQTKGTMITVTTPAGVLHFQILTISNTTLTFQALSNASG